MPLFARMPLRLPKRTFMFTTNAIIRTGFDVSFKPRWTQLGRNNRSLAKDWAADAQGYFSLCASGQPNYFIFNGPSGPVGHGSLSSAIDWEAEYILKWINKVAHEDIK
jgi:hypothetical protein